MQHIRYWSAPSEEEEKQEEGEGEGALRDAAFVTGGKKCSGPEGSHTMLPRLCGKVRLGATQGFGKIYTYLSV